MCVDSREASFVEKHSRCDVQASVAACREGKDAMLIIQAKPSQGHLSPQIEQLLLLLTKYIGEGRRDTNNLKK